MQTKEQFKLSETDENRIREYRKCLAKGFGYGDYNEWPIKLNAAFHLFLKEWSLEYIKDLDKLLEEKTLEEVAELFYNPSRFYRIIDSTIYGLRRSSMPLVDQKKYILKILNMGKSRKYGPEFNENGSNIIYDPLTVDEVSNNLLKKAHDDDSKIIHKFCGIMWAYAECIYFRAHDVPKEIHGPYEYGKDNKFVVQEYLNLQPDDLWDNITLLPCSKVRIIKGYNKNIDIKVDILNHLYHEGGDLVSNLNSWYIEIDREEKGPEDLAVLCKIAEKTILEVNILISKMSWHDKVKKYADIFWYRKKPLKDALNIPWGVPDHVIENIENGKENPVRKAKLTEEQSARLAMLTI